MTIYQDYLKENILNQPGLIAWWPLDDLSGNSYSRVLNPPVVAGRNLAVNGAFDSDTIWTKGTNWTITGGTAVATATTSASPLSQAAILTIGKVYSVTYDAVVTVGSVRTEVGSTGSGTTRTVSGTYTEVIAAVGSTALRFNAVSTFTGTIDNVIVTELNIPPSGCIYSNPTLIADGDMEAAGTASWTVGNSATLSKQTGTPHSGGQVLRIARNAVSTPYTGQTVLTIGQVYRVYGYCRSDGSATPIARQGSTTIFTGTTSTTWQSFDIIFVATATDIEFGSTTNTGTQYVEFDDCTVVLDASLRPGELIQDGDMEASGTGYWSTTLSATLTKETGTPHNGSQCLRIARNGTNNPNALQRSIFIVGKKYRVTGFARSDGSAIPLWTDGTTTWFTGTTSTSWQPFDVVFIAAGTAFGMASTTSTGTQYTEWDDISIIQVSPLVGLPLNGVAQQSPTFGHLLNCYNFDGSNDVVNIYSSQLNGIFNPSEGTLFAWAQVVNASVWSDATQRFIVTILVDGNNEITLHKNTTTNQLRFQYFAGGTNKTISDTSLVSKLQWFQMALSWSKSADQMKAYLNGIQVGAITTGLGTWAGNISSNSAVIGAANTAASAPWSGKINDVRLYNRALSASEILALYRKYLPQYQMR